MKRFLISIALLALMALPVRAQRYVRSLNTIQDLVTSNPNNLNTNVLVTGYYAPGDWGGRANIFTYIASSTAATNFGTIFMPTNGVGRWQGETNGPLNIRWFGAIPDPATDNTKRISNAVFIAGSGGKLFVPSGRYGLTSLTITNFNFTIQGEESSGNDNTNKMYRSAGSEFVSLSSGESMLHIAGDGFISLKSLTLTGNATCTNGVWSALNYFTIENCTIQGFTDTGIYLVYPAQWSWIDHCYITHNKYGIYLDPAIHTIISRCLIQTQTGAGIFATGNDIAGSTDILSVSGCHFNQNVVAVELRSGTRNASFDNCYIGASTNENMIVRGFNQAGWIRNCFFEEPGAISGNEYFSLKFTTNSAGSGSLGPDTPQGWLVENCVFTATPPGHGISIEKLSKSIFRNILFQRVSDGSGGTIIDTTNLVASQTMTNVAFVNLLDSGGSPLEFATNIFTRGVNTAGITAEGYNLMRGTVESWNETGGGLLRLSRDAGSLRGTMAWGRHHGTNFQTTALIQSLSDSATNLNGTLNFQLTDGAGVLGNVLNLIETNRLQVIGGLIVGDIPVYANNAAAAAAGLVVGRLYRSGGDPDVVSVVH
jgi:hypothetical protein